MSLLAPRSVPAIVFGLAALVLAFTVQLTSAVWNDQQGDPKAADWDDAPLLLAFGVVALGLAFGLAIPPARRVTPAASPRHRTTLSVALDVGAVVATVLLFWNPAPAVLGAGAYLLGRDAQRQPKHYTHARLIAIAGVVIGSLAVAIPLLLAAAGAIADT